MTTFPQTCLTTVSKFFPLLAVFLSGAGHCSALTITSAPRFTKAAKAPLAGILGVTTDEDSRVSVSVEDGAGTWDRHFYDYGTNHSLSLLGFKPGRTNVITVTVRDRRRHLATTAAPVTFITAPLSNDFPKLTLLISKPEKMEPGYTLLRAVSAGFGTDYLIIVNNAGEVVWYSGNSSGGVSIDSRQLENGNLFYPRSSDFVELNLQGVVVRSWPQVSMLPIDPHDGVPTDHDTILYISDASRSVPNFRTNTTDSNAPLANATVKYNQVVEMSATNGALLSTWSLLDMLDPTRVDYLLQWTGVSWDAEHANAVLEDPRDDSLIVSLRNQDAVIKFARSSGRLKWILGSHANWGPAFQQYLLTPVGEPFEWNYAQHAPMLTPQGTLLLYDNGNFRASPFDTSVPDQSNYSRAVEFQIDEDKMEVRQVWQYGKGISEQLFTGSVGDADLLPHRGNVLITFGTVAYVNGAHPSPYATNALMARIKEVTHEAVPEVVFDLAVFDYANTNSNYRGNWVYRSDRIPDLYGHPALPVEDLNVRYESGIAQLEFSADETRTYSIESSTDLIHWEELGAASLDASGEFEFEDDYAGRDRSQFYRVLTR